MRKRIFFVLLLFPVISGCAGTHRVPGQFISRSPLPRPKASVYRLGPGDELEINFYYHPEMNQTVTIRPDGRISLPAIDEIEAAGLTPVQLDSLITERYSWTMVEPEVTIHIRKSAGQKVFVGGEVNKPGLVTIDGQLTLVAALFQAGWVTRKANLKNIVIIRNNTTKGLCTINVDLSSINKTCNSHQTLILQPYDLIFVPGMKGVK